MKISPRHLFLSSSRPNEFAASICLCLGLAGMAAAEQTAPDVSLSAPSSFRVVQGSTLGPLSFSATNLNASASTSFDLALTGGSVGTAPTSPATLTAGQTTSFAATPNIGGLVAGQSMSFGLSASHANWTNPVAAATNISVVANRQLTGSATLNVGRHIVGVLPIGGLTLNGGAQTDSEATRISIHSGGYAQFSNGLRLSTASDFTFNGANQTYTLQVGYNGPTGNYSVSGFSLPGPSQNSYTTQSGQIRQEFGGAWKTSAEYGNSFGEKKVFTEENRAQWDALPSNDRLWQLPGTSGGSSNDYVYRQEVVGTPQPVISAVRNDANATGVNTAWQLARGAGPLVNERINPLMSGEVIQGSNLDLSGVSLSVTGTAVANRSINGGMIDLGRRMAGSANQSISRNDTVTLWTAGSDNHRTRLNLGGFNLSDAGGAVTATHAGNTSFTDGSNTASVQVTGNFNIDTSVLGRVSKTVNAGSSISGEGLAGESVQNNLQVGYTWNNVQDNQLYARDLLIIDTASRSDTRAYWTDAGRVFSTETHTAIGWSGSGLDVSGSMGSGMHDLGSRTVTAIAEGLAGENASATASFTTHYAGITAAAFQVSHNGAGETLTNGNVITLRDTGSGIYQNKTVLSGVTIAGGQGLDYQLSYSGGSTLLDHGSSRSFTIQYTGNTSLPAAGQLSRISRGNLSIALGESVNTQDIRNAWGKSGTYRLDYNGNHYTANFDLETRFDAPASATGSSNVAAGTDFATNGLALNNTGANTSSRFNEATSVEFVDSQALGASTTVQVEFIALDAADPAVVAALENSSANAASLAGVTAGWSSPSFVSDIVAVHGLDGVMQVMQLGYDESSTVNEAAAQILWQYDFNDGGTERISWINAVLGNSNISNLDLNTGGLVVDGNLETIHSYLESMRFAGSYEDYLADLGSINPQLGAWGVDAASNKVWAVIDHNSSFGAGVPEPSGVILLILSGAGLAMRRKRP